MSAGQLASLNNINGPKQRLHSNLFNSDVKSVTAQQHLVKEVIEMQRKAWAASFPDFQTQ